MKLYYICIMKSIVILTGFFEGVEGFKSVWVSSDESWLPFLTASCPLIARVWLLFRLILLQLMAHTKDHTKSQCALPQWRIFKHSYSKTSRQNLHSLFPNSIQSCGNQHMSSKFLLQLTHIDVKIWHTAEKKEDADNTQAMTLVLICPASFRGKSGIGSSVLHYVLSFAHSVLTSSHSASSHC